MYKRQAQGLPRGGQFGLLCGKLLGAAGGQFLLGGGLLCGQRLHSGLGGGNGLLGLFQLALRRVHTGAQGAAVGFQLVQCRLCVRAPGVGQGGAPLCDLLLQRVSTCILCGSAAVGLGSGLLQRRTLADLFLPVGFQLRLAAAVGLGLSALCFAVCLCRLQSGILFGQNVGHQGKGEGDCALRGGKALRQQGLGVPPERSFRLIGSGKGALGGSAGVLRLPVSFRSGLPCGFHLCLCGRSMGQQGAGGVMGAAAHRAGCAFGQALGQQSGLCVQECPFQRVPPGAGFVLCGGSGTRLWPLSRALYPKQFMDLGGHTLFGDTVDRAAALPDSADPLVVCNEEHRFYVAAALQQKGVSGTILLEPKGRNTAPAIALVAFAALSGGGDPLLLVLPSDHVLKPQDVFAEAVARARACAESGRIVTFGITPDAPETGFGYIRRGGALPSGGYAVARFVEKPDLARAEAMLADGGYLWNSGMFLFRASIYLEELALHAPGIHAACKAAWEGHHADRDFIRPDADAFLSSPADSIDYAVMEKTDRAAVVPLTADWSDLGSWEAFYEAAPHDGDGNVRVGDVYAEGAENCYLHASNRMVAALGVSDLVVVETADSVLVADRARTQDVKKIVESLKKEGRGEAENHPLVYRPWGSYETLARGERFQVKRIIVKPGGQLSLQKHHHRAEHWVVVEGTAEITVGDKVLLYHEDQSTYIPLGTVHRLKNPGMIPLVIIEIQSGTYLGEDDIVRLEDSYGR